MLNVYLKIDVGWLATTQCSCNVALCATRQARTVSSFIDQSECVLLFTQRHTTSRLRQVTDLEDVGGLTALFAVTHRPHERRL